MKNFEMKYPVEGTSALKPKLDTAPAQRACIIAFPEAQVRHDARTASAPMRMDQKPFFHCVESAVASVMAGTAQGSSFGRMQRWQAVLGGCAFAALAFGSILFSM